MLAASACAILGVVSVFCMRTMLGIARGERKPMSPAFQPCPLWRRLAALAYDLLITLAIVMVVGLACQLATGGRLIETGPRVHVPLWYQALQGAVVAGYFVASWHRGGQTLGMRAWRIRVSRDDGTPISLQQAVVRLLVGAAPLGLLLIEPLAGARATPWLLVGAWVIWFAFAMFDPRRRALHDIAADSEVGA